MQRNGGALAHTSRCIASHIVPHCRLHCYLCANLGPITPATSMNLLVLSQNADGKFYRTLWNLVSFQLSQLRHSSILFCWAQWLLISRPNSDNKPVSNRYTSLMLLHWQHTLASSKTGISVQDSTHGPKYVALDSDTQESIVFSNFCVSYDPSLKMWYWHVFSDLQPASEHFYPLGLSSCIGIISLAFVPSPWS